MLEEIHQKILKSGFIFCHGRDKFHRPILFLRVQVASRQGFSHLVPEVLNAVNFAVFYMVTHMCVEGKIENNLNIFDLEKA